MDRHARGASIRVVAAQAGVSVSTVSNVLNEKSSVAPEIAARVNAAVDSLGYVRDNRASRLRSGKSHLVGVIVPDLTNTMFAAFVSTLEQTARGDGYDLVVVSSNNDPAEETRRLRRILEWRPAGLIVIPCDGALPDRVPHHPPLPLVVADRIPDRAIFDLVAVDNAATAGAIVRHLAAQGIADCLVLGTDLAISNVRERWEGARAAATSIQLELIEVGFSGLAPAALEDRLRGPDLPSAIFCLDHGTTLWSYQLLVEIGLRPGIDLAFASFDETEWMRLVTPPITAARQPVEEMAEYSWSQLKRRIHGEDGPALLRRLRCVLTIRGSTPRENPSPEDEGTKTRNGGKHPCTQQSPDAAC